MSVYIEEGSVEGDSKYVGHSKSDILELALGVRAGTIFGSWMLSETDRHLLNSIFMPLMFMDDMHKKTLIRDEIVHFYGKLNDAAPRSINGFPMFFSMRSINKEDCDHLQSTLEHLEDFMSEDD